jgi:hypothetical protein
MWILFAALIVLAAVGLLLVKLNTVAKQSEPVWKKVDAAAARPGNSSLTISIDDPVVAANSAAMPEKAMAAKHS